ncbi:glycosyltransferase [Hymenobacter sp. BT664]|uniref:Glycosyltransferase n=1 Tax=Hymenobacter montanus TaxID=2771359 RepID=A0A927BAB5_9BACT|nr:glycosyltransferase [Hymenobacter montanus]MBD2766514.1 glycosyltransferase [Hymenobacter montanus]
MLLSPVISSPFFWLLLACVLVQGFYAAYFFWSFARRAPEPLASAPGPDTEPVSIVVCARNELENLRRLLPLLLEQDYPPGFEIILIDDRSADDTYLYAQQLVQYYAPRLRLVTISSTPEGFAPKKYALTLGIKATRYQRLLFTDADCIPATNQWLRLMQRGFANYGRQPADLVVGYSAYTEAPGFLNQLIRYETLVTAAQYLSFAWRGWPYMGVGRNLAYTRGCFTATKGFASHIRQLSGDDDLLVQDAVRQGQRVAVVADPSAHTLSEPAPTWGGWWHQKRRHLSAGRAYRLADRLRIGIFMTANGLFYGSAIALVFSPNNWVPLAVVCTLRTLFVGGVYARLSRRLHQPVTVGLLPVLDAVYFFQYLALGVSLFLNRTLRWK